MTKKRIVESKNLIVESNIVLNKKTKLEKEIIQDAILKDSPKFDIKNHKLEKFLIIFDALINQIKEQHKDENSNDEKK